MVLYIIQLIKVVNVVIIIADCSTINYAANPGDRVYYALCLTINNIITAIILFRCPDPDNFQYN